ncbi:unnamed protein product [Acanthosepion pharaonis]|uniref:Uncharacterized protein n=1 Tax=Acanthosepion pharaonis TaxID=158019 RepID=A0A812B294_ACAPH|nr:unnamed protein product [Sepia pharaonis]
MANLLLPFFFFPFNWLFLIFFFIYSSLTGISSTLISSPITNALFFVPILTFIYSPFVSHSFLVFPSLTFSLAPLPVFVPPTFTHSLTHASPQFIPPSITSLLVLFLPCSLPHASLFYSFFIHSSFSCSSLFHPLFLTQSLPSFTAFPSHSSLMSLPHLFLSSFYSITFHF